MIKLDILPYPLYKFQIDPVLADEVLEHVKNLKFEKNLSNNNNLDMHINYYHEKLFTFFNESVNSVKQLYYRDEIDFPIVDCWANRYGPLEKISNHTHANGMISGVYYANAEENFGPTVFNINDPWCSDFFSDKSEYKLITIFKENYKQMRVRSEVIPEKGSLLLFPSHIFHFVKPNLNKKISRYTVSFNTFPSGIISFNPTSMLELKTVSVQDKQNGSKKE